MASTASRKGVAKKGVAKKGVTKKGVTKKAAAKKVAATKTAAPDDEAAIRRDFKQVVNMSAAAIGKWLATDESHTVGAKDGKTGTSTSGPESVGHASGRRIIQLLGKSPQELTSSDYAHMRKVVGYVRRHLAQHPKVEDVKTSRWRYSLMNWGHDPAKR